MIKDMGMISIVEEMLKDVREDEQWLQIKDKVKWENMPGSRADVYAKDAGNRLNNKNIDAERWSRAISSYKKYSCFAFSDDDVAVEGKYYYNTKDFYIHYVKRDGKEIKIQADILTNYGTIHKLFDKFRASTDEEKKLMIAFDRIAYTIGAFCPIWKNPGGRGAVNDTVWDKLLNSGLVDDEGKIIKSCNDLENRDSEDIRNRHKEKLFLIIPEKRIPHDVVIGLYFQDYFSYKWELLTKIGNINELNSKEEVYSYIKDIIVLIVQRSYRIISNYRGNVLREQDKKIIQNALDSIGLNDVECIYSKKRR